jgi:hypothetical protein
MLKLGRGSARFNEQELRQQRDQRDGHEHALIRDFDRGRPIAANLVGTALGRTRVLYRSGFGATIVRCDKPGPFQRTIGGGHQPGCQKGQTRNGLPPVHADINNPKRAGFNRLSVVLCMGLA